MVSIKKNYEIWNNNSHWDKGSLGDGVSLDNGEKWSKAWGTSEAQWEVSIYPRIKSYLPCEKILEVAPGRGRWTRFLKDECKSLIVVDLSENCIDFCRKRFSDEKHISYYVNNGKSLEFQKANSINFLFSFDSLVHVDLADMEAYIKEFSRVLEEEGAGFIHHSNLGSYSKGVKSKTHMRSRDVSGEKVKSLLCDAGLVVVSQELVHWSEDNKEEGVYLDAFTTFVKRGNADLVIGTKENSKFFDEQKEALKISQKVDLR